MNPELQECIHTLWDALADRDAARFDADADRLMVSLCELVAAQNAVWVGSVRLGEAFPADPVKGWRASVFRYLYPTPLLGDIAREQAKDLYRGVADATTIANVLTNLKQVYLSLISHNFVAASDWITQPSTSNSQFDLIRLCEGSRRTRRSPRSAAEWESAVPNRWTSLVCKGVVQRERFHQNENC